MGFTERVVYGEDAAVLYAALSNASAIYIQHRAYYHYIMRENSAMHTEYPRFLVEKGLIYEYIKSYLKHSMYYDTLTRQLEKYIAEQVMIGFRHNFQSSFPVYYPQLMIEKHTKILLYGAGNVGQDYYELLKEDYQIVGWVDKQYNDNANDGTICGTELIDSSEFDYLVIAVLRENLAKQISIELIEEKGICKDKIIWCEPRKLISFMK